VSCSFAECCAEPNSHVFCEMLHYRETKSKAFLRCCQSMRVAAYLSQHPAVTNYRPGCQILHGRKPDLIKSADKQTVEQAINTSTYCPRSLYMTNVPSHRINLWSHTRWRPQQMLAPAHKSKVIIHHALHWHSPSSKGLVSLSCSPEPPTCSANMPAQACTLATTEHAGQTGKHNNRLL